MPRRKIDYQTVGGYLLFLQVAVDTFLRVNGFKIVVSSNRAHREIISMLENHQTNKINLEKFLRRHVVPLS
ncbi:MAG: hypothetical protein CMQ21_07735 [Gammaproteobacteria bacterium]|jgi:prophage maintenance system killer protein|nr:hypothetical protein [Gammaproteobacteria bacterium]